MIDFLICFVVSLFTAFVLGGIVFVLLRLLGLHPNAIGCYILTIPVALYFAYKR